MRFQTSSVLPFLPALAAAIAPPSMDGFSILFSDDFAGSAGSSPNTDTWNVATAIDTNAEVQTYTTSNSNLQISGGQTIQFVPQKSPSGIWTSGRIETVGAWTPAVGKVMVIQSSILLGDNAEANKQGIWPAFWALGDAMRHGTQWPLAGEIDIFEQVDGVPTAYGTLHCGSTTGGPCNSPSGKGASVALPTEGFNTWGVRIDLTNSDWTQQTIEWQLNGATFNTVTGSDIGDEGTWGTLAHSPLYILLNVAVGGDWPGEPNDATTAGYGSMMEVQYVAVYST
ncbi:putative GH16 domain-containing protein [Seiridium unicorne]|uniref:GH16 domain-containing protein n=1 Tax=Seiridium unicorne TaxID=138068 RepID=A0ABR2UQS7_9PEZI